jgi:ferredoxin
MVIVTIRVSLMQLICAPGWVFHLFLDDKCVACGACVEACPKDLIELRKQFPKNRKVVVSCHEYGQRRVWPGKPVVLLVSVAANVKRNVNSMQSLLLITWLLSTPTNANYAVNVFRFARQMPLSKKVSRHAK